MKEVFDWKAFRNSMGCLSVLTVGALIVTVGYFLLYTFLFFLPAVVAIFIILAIPVIFWKMFKIMFFKKN